MQFPSILEQARAKLRGTTGPAYWRSLEELAQVPEFQQFLDDEFAFRLPSETDQPSRRKFLGLIGASLALAGGTACTKQPNEVIVPYVEQPEEYIPGKPLFYATAMPLRGIATGLLVKSHLGRPTKVEGNPLHPASLGASDAFSQASILTLYDPDRSTVVLINGELNSWEAFASAASEAR